MENSCDSCLYGGNQFKQYGVCGRYWQNTAGADAGGCHAAAYPTVFPVGTYNARNTAHFTGDSYVASLSDGNVPVANVTFVHGVHTYWHIHHGTSQTLLAVSGKGYYQLDGQAPHVLLPGQSVTIPAGVRHWHGAAPGHMFQHIAVMEPVQGAWTEWREPVDKQLFDSLT